MRDPTRRLIADASKEHERARRLPRDLLRDVHVLVVDDNEDALDIFTAFFRYFGAHVVTSNTARSALGIVQSARVNVVVSDLMMPGEDGLWLIHQVRRLRPERGGTIPMVAVTAYRYTYNENHISEKGFEAYLTKPIDAYDLITTVARLVGRYTG